MKNLEIGDIIGKGKRGVVKVGKYGGKACAIKIPNPKSEAVGRIGNEGFWLRKLNELGIGPKLYYFDEKLLVMEFLEGVHLSDFLKKNERGTVLKNILLQCRKLDKAKVNKYEMHSVTKNVIVVKNKPVMIDFERCKRVEDPKNVTQFCQFLMKRGFGSNNKRMRDVLKKYKKELNDECFKDIVKFFF